MKYLLLILFSLNLYSQSDKVMSSSTNASGVLEYDIKLFFPYSVIHQYRVDEETEVERTYEDGTPYTYKKRQTWYVTFVAPNIKGRDGEKQVYVTIDSLDYEFKDGKYDIRFNNTFEGIPPGHVWDFKKTFFLNAKEFDMFYDSYNKAYKIESEKFAEDIKMVRDYAEKSDDFRSKLLTKRYDESELLFIADPVKGILPYNKVAIDSTWKVDFNFDIDYVAFNNVSSATLTNVLDNHYFIKIQADSLYCVDKEMIMDNIKKVGKIDAGLASGMAEMKISSKGHIKYLTTNFNAEIYGKVDNIKFIEKKKTRVSWNLVGMWKQ